MRNQLDSSLSDNTLHVIRPFRVTPFNNSCIHTPSPPATHKTNSSSHSPTTHSLYTERNHPLTYSHHFGASLLPHPFSFISAYTPTHYLPLSLYSFSKWVKDSATNSRQFGSEGSKSTVIHDGEVVLPGGKPCVLQCSFLRFLSR
jgi:hypothetical protein